MLSFRPNENISLVENLTSRIQHYYFLFQSFNRYRKTFKNYLDVIKNFRKNELRIKCIMEKGDVKILNKFQIIMFTRNVEKYCKFNNEILNIKIRDLAEIKMTDWENNGDFFSTALYNDEYESLPIKNKEVIDIGANNGDTSIYFAMRGAKNIIALEPLPMNFESAKKNIELNKLSNTINIIMAGCGGTNGEIKIASELKGASYSTDDQKQGRSVPIITLKDILKNSKSKNRILKMDCEGCEYDTILLSSKEVLQEFDIIKISYHFGYKNLVEKLRNSGFEVSYTKPLYYNNIFTEESKMFLGDIFARKII
jgi:FkbM family methyltransferase